MTHFMFLEYVAGALLTVASWRSELALALVLVCVVCLASLTVPSYQPGRANPATDLLSGVGRRERLVAALVRPFARIGPLLYHLWYYYNYKWSQTSWMGVPTLKSPSDMWNYQEILHELKPSVLIEFGTCRGGATLFFASVLRQIGVPFKIVSVDVARESISASTAADSDVILLTMSSADHRVKDEICRVRDRFPGPAFAILDSDHGKAHVLQEMMLLRDVLRSGDYLIVEDSNVNGHPIWLPAFGPGPYQAIQEYFRLHPNDYAHDEQREKKFGFTFATNGFLLRR